MEMCIRDRIGGGSIDAKAGNVYGGVTFTNLAWDDPQGNPILRVPTGTLKEMCIRDSIRPLSAQQPTRDML